MACIQIANNEIKYSKFQFHKILRSQKFRNDSSWYIKFLCKEYYSKMINEVYSLFQMVFKDYNYRMSKSILRVLRISSKFGKKIRGPGASVPLCVLIFF
jgi:hypothetical protein